MRKYQKVLVIVGPTSSGKSALAVELARKLNGEVICADSRQVYKGLNIGTGKITRREMKGVRHHLLDVASPKKIFTAQNFVVQGRKAIENITAQGKLPIIAGGTGFYIDALLGRVALPNVPPNPQLRAKLERMTAKRLFALLKKKDPRRARTIDGENKRRIIRALEIIARLGRVPANSGSRNPKYDTLWIGMTLQSKVLSEKIHERLLSRMKRGMVAEARRLHKAGLPYTQMEQLGLEYRALARHLRGEITRAQMVEKLDRDIRHYAKRQLTYWKHNKNILWHSRSSAISLIRIKKWLHT